MEVFWGKQACSAYYAKIFLGQHMFLIFLFEMMHCLCFTPSHSLFMLSRAERTQSGSPDL